MGVVYSPILSGKMYTSCVVVVGFFVFVFFLIDAFTLLGSRSKIVSSVLFKFSGF